MGELTQAQRALVRRLRAMAPPEGSTINFDQCSTRAMNLDIREAADLIEWLAARAALSRATTPTPSHGLSNGRGEE